MPSLTATTVEVIDFTYTQESGKPVHAPTETKLNGASTQYDYTATGTRLNKVDGFNTTAYEVNYDNQIKKITEGGIVTNFFYDADGKRIKKTQGAYTTLYFGRDFEIINSTPTLYVFAGNLRFGKMTAAGTEYYHKDHQGSTNAITTDTGTILDTAEYLPYGPDRSANALLNRSAYKYTDQEQDVGTGLYNYDARLYDPVLGQFVMADTIVPDPLNPQSLNRYAYCLNNPIRYVDPTGHDSTGIDGICENRGGVADVGCFDGSAFGHCNDGTGFLGPCPSASSENGSNNSDNTGSNNPGNSSNQGTIGSANPGNSDYGGYGDGGGSSSNNGSNRSGLNGLGASGSIGLIGVVDASVVGTIVSGNGNIGFVSSIGASSGPQLAFGAGPTTVYAPFAQKPDDLKGTTIDIHIRLVYQLTVSIPTTGDKNGLAFAIDPTPGWNLGIGIGASFTAVFFTF